MGAVSGHHRVRCTHCGKEQQRTRISWLVCLHCGMKGTIVLSPGFPGPSGESPTGRDPLPEA